MTTNKNQTWSVWHIVNALIVALLFSFFFYIFSLAIRQSVNIDIPKQIFIAISSTGSTLCATFYLLKKYPTNYSLNKIKTNIKNILKWGAIGGITISIIQFPYTTILGGKEIKAKLFIPSHEGIEHITILLVLSVIITPIIEELFFRLCVYKILKNRFNIRVGYIGTALIFSVMHTASFFQAFLFIVSSIILTYIYEKTGLIETSMLAHSIWNTVWFLSVYAYHISSTI